MIRRQTSDGYWLIKQNDHAVLAGEMARHLGNAQVVRPDPFESTLLGIANHDAGWPLHDDRPTLSAAKIPLDVFESPRQITHKVWLESANRAIAIDPYAGLLVCLHGLSLSAASVSANQPAKFDPQQLRQQFDLNKFQHQMIERLEHLRPKVGLRIDRPLRLGLADSWTEPAEEMLKYNLRMLQAMDVLSLSICCTTPPDFISAHVSPTPGAQGVKLKITRPTPNEIRVSPWLFDVAKFEVSVPYRVVPQRTYQSNAELQVVYATAEIKSLPVTVVAG
jgi:hypothetical protein